jgi:tRNA modification GTPase
MYPDHRDTIAALATAHGTAPIAIVRLSGPQAPALVEKIFHTRSGKPVKLGEIRT